jgi:hypothetical protein
MAGNNVIKFKAKDLANFENITVNHAYRKFKKIRSKLNLPAVRRFLTMSEVQKFYKLSDSDIEELQKNM